MEAALFNPIKKLEIEVTKLSMDKIILKYSCWGAGHDEIKFECKIRKIELVVSLCTLFNALQLGQR